MNEETFRLLAVRIVALGDQGRIRVGEMLVFCNDEGNDEGNDDV